jgi:LysM repeat protein
MWATLSAVRRQRLPPSEAWYNPHVSQAQGRGRSTKRAVVRAVCGVVVIGLLLSGFVGCGSVLTPPPTLTPTPAPTSALGMANPTIAPEIYLTPIPPTPTFTPSPTPTPVIHIVAGGDTLLGIALDYGTTVAALVRMNGLNPEAFLRIGQSLVVPMEEEEALSVDSIPVPQGNVILPTPTPVPLVTGGISLYRTPVGGLWCMGEVLNTSGEPVTNLQLEVTLLAPDDTPLLVARALAAADYLAPEARAPFSLLFRSPPEGVVSAEVRLLRGEAISPITAGFAPLQVVDAEGSVSGPQYRVRGLLRNDSSRAVSRVTVVATIYGDNGDVVGFRQLVMPTDVTIPPGGEQPFDLLLTPQQVAPPSDFSTIAWGVGG